MAKLIFRYGAMGSSKTANALMVRYNYLDRGQNVLLLKPKLENRDGKIKVKSRIGLEADCLLAEDYLDYLKPYMKQNFLPDKSFAIIVDEVQFLSPDRIDQLAQVVDQFNIPVICYGLKTDFTGHLFDGAKRLMELADEIEEVPTICWCGKKARFNARVDENGKIIRNGEQVVLGGNETYTSLCRKHFMNGKTEKEQG